MSAGQGKENNYDTKAFERKYSLQKKIKPHAPCFFKAMPWMNSNHENHHCYALFWNFVGKGSEMWTLSFAFSEEVHSLLLASQRWMDKWDSTLIGRRSTVGKGLRSSDSFPAYI